MANTAKRFIAVGDTAKVLAACAGVGSGGRLRKVPVCGGVGPGGGFRKVPESSSVVWFVALQL